MTTTAAISSRRAVVLTDHAVEQAQSKFIELAIVPHDALHRLLTAAAGNAKPSPFEHVVKGQGFLDGTVWLDDHDVLVSFAYREDEDGTLRIVTTLTRDEVKGHGASR